MRVGIFVPEVAPVSGGEFTYVDGILDAVGRASTSHEIWVIHYGVASAAVAGKLPRVRLENTRIPAAAAIDEAAAAQRLDLVWFLTPGAEPVRVPFVATVWDLEHRRQPFFPEVSVAGWRWEERELCYRSTLPRATLVLTGTEEGRRQVREFYGVAEARIAVVPLPTPTFSAREREGADLEAILAGLPRPFVFYPAQFWAHKNHVALLLALRALADEGLRLGAVFTGIDKGNLAHVEATAAELGLTEQLRFLGFVERRVLVALYREALALVFPSFFGPDNLPPLEAFTLGCPVVAAAVQGAEERLGDAALWFDPRREDELAAAVRRLHGDAELGRELVRRGRERSAGWSEDDYVAAVLARFDEFAALRRTWGRGAPHLQP